MEHDALLSTGPVELLITRGDEARSAQWSAYRGGAMRMEQSLVWAVHCSPANLSLTLTTIKPPIIPVCLWPLAIACHLMYFIAIWTETHKWILTLQLACNPQAAMVNQEPPPGVPSPCSAIMVRGHQPGGGVLNPRIQRFRNAALLVFEDLEHLKSFLP